MTDRSGSEFCPEVGRTCIAWFGGEFTLRTNLDAAISFHNSKRSVIGDTPVLNRLVGRRKREVLDSYEEVARQISMVIRSAGSDFSTTQCNPVQTATLTFNVLIDGGVMMPDPRMSSRPVRVNLTQK